MSRQITFLITDAYGRTIDPRTEFASIEEARNHARSIYCPCGVWVCPSVWDEIEGGYVGIGLDEEISQQEAPKHGFPVGTRVEGGEGDDYE